MFRNVVVMDVRGFTILSKWIIMVMESSVAGLGFALFYLVPPCRLVGDFYSGAVENVPCAGV